MICSRWFLRPSDVLHECGISTASLVQKASETVDAKTQPGYYLLTITPYNGLSGVAPPEWGTLFRLEVYKRLGIHELKRRKGLGKLTFRY